MTHLSVCICTDNNTNRLSASFVLLYFIMGRTTNTRWIISPLCGSSQVLVIQTIDEKPAYHKMVSAVAIESQRIPLPVTERSDIMSQMFSQFYNDRHKIKVQKPIANCDWARTVSFIYCIIVVAQNWTGHDESGSQWRQRHVMRGERGRHIAWTRHYQLIRHSIRQLVSAHFTHAFHIPINRRKPSNNHFAIISVQSSVCYSHSRRN